MIPIRDSAALLALAAITAAMASGCGTGQYNEAVAARIADINAQAAAGGPLFEGTTDAKKDGTVTTGTIRLPQLFASPADGGQVPFVALPGFGYSFQQSVDAGGTPANVYVYFAGVDAASTSADQLKTTLKTEVDKVMVGNWEEVTLTAPGGAGTVNASRLRVSGPQDFGGAQAEGQFDLYLITTGANHVLIGWRAPKAAADQHNFPAAAEASTATFLAAG